jgi:Zn ribbon nucleic-acid-binding protein
MREWPIRKGAHPCPKCRGTDLSAWTDQCAEDSVDAWVECRSCGHTGERVEHTWGGREAAEWAVGEWNYDSCPCGSPLSPGGHCTDEECGSSQT